MKQDQRVVMAIMRSGLIVLLGIGIVSLTAVNQARGSQAAELVKAYDDAKLFFETWEEDKAIALLEETTGCEDFRNAEPGFKCQVYLLLANCYHRKAKREAVEELLRLILELDPKFSFDEYPDSQELSAIADSLRAVYEPEPPRRIFSFAPVKTVSSKVGEEQRVPVRTVPDSVPVQLRLTEIVLGARLEQTAGNEAILYFRPTEDLGGKITGLALEGSTADTTIAYTVLFEVRPQGKSNRWKYLLAGAGGVAVAAVIIALGGGDEGADPKDESLPGFPDPPGGGK